MKTLNIWSILLSLLFVITTIHIGNAQKGIDDIIPKKEVGQLIDSIAQLVEYYYISEDLGKEMGRYIKAQHQKGAYDDLSYKAFGKALKKDFVSVSGDVHMSAFYRLQKDTPQESILSFKSDNYGEVSNYGYVETKITKDNIGYLRVAHFTKWSFFEEAKQAASNAIQLLENTDALIVDVRDNPGGFEDIVAYFMSHFFAKEPFLLQEYYCRYQDRSNHISTTKDVASRKLSDAPIYILINKGTGSAAESFAYMMKHLDRATLIGETSVGAGNGSNYFRVSKEFMVQIATWETLNAITKKSWEKVGVSPHIETSGEGAFDKAMELAKASAKKQRSKKEKGYQTLLSQMEQVLGGEWIDTSEEEILQTITTCQKAGLIKEGDINNRGYALLLEEEKTQMAEIVFKANTILYPNSANVYDSYGEALAMNNKLQASLESYQKAVSIAKENQDPDVAIFVDNLEKMKSKMSKKH